MIGDFDMSFVTLPRIQSRVAIFWNPFPVAVTSSQYQPQPTVKLSLKNTNRATQDTCRLKCAGFYFLCRPHHIDSLSCPLSCLTWHNRTGSWRADHDWPASIPPGPWSPVWSGVKSEDRSRGEETPTFPFRIRCGRNYEKIRAENVKIIIVFTIQRLMRPGNRAVVITNCAGPSLVKWRYQGKCEEEKTGNWFSFSCKSF